MVNDTILAGLTNLFALFGARDCVDIEVSKKKLHNYLTRHFGIRDTENFILIYETLRDLYESSPDIDKEAIIKDVCTKIQTNFSTEEQALFLLRLMQFCVNDELGYLADDELFQTTASLFGVSHERFLAFCDFVGDKESKLVRRIVTPGIDGHITTFWMPHFNRIQFTYTGNDEILMDDVPVLPDTFQTWSQSSVVKNVRTGTRLYYSTAKALYSKEDTGKEVEFCGRDINFRFPNSDNGMHDFSFTLHSGELVAVMGGSGTGKSTLMSLLNGSLTPQSGSITINGHSITENGAKELIGFVPQDDLLIEELTVYQNLWYTAKLCFEGMSDAEIHKRVLGVLRQLGLDSARDLKVGSAINKYISGGQRKRLNIALELIREPAILFLDEPTSGLSSTDTENVINILKELTYKGKLIIINIHQPSSDVYKLFDRLWLLDRGGYPVFDGNPIEAITYFKTAANYADANTSTCPTCGNVNPEVILNIIDEKALDESGRMKDERKFSPKEWHDMYLKWRNRMPLGDPKKADVPPTDQKRPGVLHQFAIQLHRNFRTKITNLQYLLITLLEAPLLAAVCAYLTHYAPTEGYSVMDNKNLVSYLFMAVIVAIFIGMSGSAEEIIKDRALLKREKFLSLSYASYITSKIVFMAGVTLFQTLLFVGVGNLIMELHDVFLVWWGLLFLAAFLSSLIGLLLSQCLNSVVSIYISIPILLIPQILLCGLVVNFSDLTPNSTTGNVPVIGDVIPSRWAYEALSVTQFKDNKYEAPLFDIQRKKYEAQYYLFAYLYEVQSQLETMNDEKTKGEEVKPEHMDVIKKALPTLSDICNMKPYTGDYSYKSLRAYTDEAERILSDRCNKATLAEDKIVTAIINKIGKEAYIDMKKAHYNMQLENFCINADTKHTHDIVDGYIVPRAGFIYLTPRSTNGRAPFYSSVKVIGDTEIPTLRFNIFVLLLMSVIVSVMLYSDYPGRYLRKDQQ